MPTDGATHSKARRAIQALLGRQAFVQVFTLAGGIVLARTLDPADFGVFGIVTFLVNALALLGDFGLAPSFIQRKEDLTDHLLQIGFTLQQMLVTAVVIVLWLAGPWLVGLYPRAPDEALWLVRALAFSLYLTTWRSMSVLQMERALNYKRLAVVEVVEHVSYQAVAVGMAVAGFGVWSLVAAVLTRGLLGTVLVYRAAPWRVRLRFDLAEARAILRYGLPFQASKLIQSVGGWVTPTLVAYLVGPQAVGFITWASSLGRKPLLLVESVMRVSFPHLSRVQHDWSTVERILTRYLTYLLAATGLWLCLTLAVGTPVVSFIYTDKWLPAVPALILFACVLSLDVVTWILGVTLNAVGYVHLAARRALVRMVFQVCFSTVFVFLVGFNGVPLGYLVGQLAVLPYYVYLMPAGSAGRIFRPLAWLLLPYGAGLAAGAGIYLAYAAGYLSGTRDVVLAASSVLVLYGGCGALGAPGFVRQRARRAVHAVKHPVAALIRKAYAS